MFLSVRNWGAMSSDNNSLTLLHLMLNAHFTKCGEYVLLSKHGSFEEFINLSTTFCLAKLISVFEYFIYKFWCNSVEKYAVVSPLQWNIADWKTRNVIFRQLKTIFL